MLARFEVARFFTSPRSGEVGRVSGRVEPTPGRSARLFQREGEVIDCACNFVGSVCAQ